MRSLAVAALLIALAGCASVRAQLQPGMRLVLIAFAALLSACATDAGAKGTTGGRASDASKAAALVGMGLVAVEAVLGPDNRVPDPLCDENDPPHTCPGRTPGPLTPPPPPPASPPSPEQ